MKMWTVEIEISSSPWDISKVIILTAWSISDVSTIVHSNTIIYDTDFLYVTSDSCITYHNILCGNNTKKYQLLSIWIFYWTRLRCYSVSLGAIISSNNIWGSSLLATVLASISILNILNFNTRLKQEFFESLQRELRQCSSGLNVDSILGNQKNKAVFTLLPPEGAGQSHHLGVFAPLPPSSEFFCNNLCLVLHYCLFVARLLASTGSLLHDHKL